MKAIAFHLMKGGVGKTTLSVSVAWELVALGHRTVLIDCDPQGNASSWLLEGKAEPEHELADALMGRIPATAAVVSLDGLDVIPTFGLGHTLRDWGKAGAASEPFAIANLVESLPHAFAVLDLGPGMGAIETAALLATDEVVVTMTPEYFALDGIETWTAAVQSIERGLRAKINYSRVVVNALNRAVGQMRDVERQVRKVSERVYTIVTDPVFRKAQEDHVPAQTIAGRAPMKPENRKTLRKIAEDLSNGPR